MRGQMPVLFARIGAVSPLMPLEVVDGPLTDGDLRGCAGARHLEEVD